VTPIILILPVGLLGLFWVLTWWYKNMYHSRTLIPVCILHAAFWQGKLDECMHVTQITYSEKKYNNAELRFCDRIFM